MTHLTQSQQAHAHRAIADAMLSGLPASATYVSDTGAMVIANEISAARWRERFGDFLAPGVRLDVRAIQMFEEVAS